MLVDGVAQVALLGRLDLDHPLGIDLVDLAQPLVALGLGGGERLAIAFLGPFQLFVAAAAMLLACLFEAGVDQRRGSTRSRRRRRPARA